MSRSTIALTITAVLLLSTSSALAQGVENCGTVQDTTLGTSGTQSATFLARRKGLPGVNLSARDIEILWDTMYGASLSGDQITTIENFITSLVTTTGSNPTAADANNLQILYNTLRREGSDWNAVNPQDSTSYRVGRNFFGLNDINTYTNADRAHSDVYLFNPARGLSGVDGSWPSQFTSDNEDYSTGHSGTDVRPLNSVMVRGPATAQSLDVPGTGWTRPTGLIRTRTDHEIGHSMPPGDSFGPLTELWSAAAEAISGSRDTTASSEFPYTWSLLAQDGGSPTCTDIRTSKSNYQGRTAFMHYVAYNFLNADTTRTLTGSTDDLLTRWAKASARKLSDLQPFLTDANCATCAAKNYFRPGGTPLSVRDRLNVLLHNWRAANFVNAPNLDEHQFGYPSWAGFSPAVNQKAWQDFDNCATDDIIALPAILALGPRQATRDTIITGMRSFRGATYPLSLTQFGSNYWVIRADPTATTNSDLVVRVIAEGT